MAEEVVRLILKAQGDAANQVDFLTGKLGGLTGKMGGLLPVAGAVGGVIAGAGVAAYSAARQLADFAEQLDKQSAETGVATDRLQAYRQIVQEGGGDPDALTRPLAELRKAIATNDPLLAKLGITTTDTSQAFEQLARILSSTSNAEKAAEVSHRLLGKGSLELTAHMKALGDSTDDVMQSMRETGSLLEGKTLASARALDSQLDQLDRNWRGALTRIQSATAPWAEEVIASFNDVWDAISGNKVDTVGEVDQKMERIQRLITKAEERRAEALEKSRGLYNAFDPATNYAEHAREETRAIADLMRQLDELAQKRRNMTGVTDEQRLKAIHGDEKPLRDVVDRLDLGGEADRAKAEKWAAEVRDLARVLDVGTEAATQFARALHHIPDKADEFKDLEKKLFGIDAEDVSGPNLKPKQITRDLGRLTLDQPVSAEEIARMHAAQLEAIKAADSLSGAIAQNVVEWDKMLDAASSTTTLVSDGLYAVQAGIDQGMAGSLQLVMEDWTNLGVVAGNVLKGIAAELERLTEQMIASGIMRLIVSVLSGGVGSATPGVAGLGGVNTGVDLPPLPVFSGRRALGRSRDEGASVTNITVNNSALDGRTLEQQWRPGGKMYETLRKLNRGRLR